MFQLVWGRWGANSIDRQKIRFCEQPAAIAAPAPWIWEPGSRKPNARVEFFDTPVQGIAEFERALALDRNLAPAHAAIGWAKYISGRVAEIAPQINEAFRLSPRDIHAHRWMLWMGFAMLHLGADVEAVGWFRRSIEANRNVPLAHFSLAAALALQGLLDQAQTAAKAGLELDPNFSLHRFRNNAAGDNPTYLAGRNRFSLGLRLAGIPEG